MDKEIDITYLKKRLSNLSGISNDAMWIAAFDEYNNDNNNTTKMSMNCRQCYYKVLMYFIKKAQ